MKLAGLKGKLQSSVLDLANATCQTPKWRPEWTADCIKLGLKGEVRGRERALGVIVWMVFKALDERR